jgi:thioredoxin 1
MAQVSTPNVKVGTDAEFAHLVLESKTPVVVEFWAQWCVWCRKLAPTYAEVASIMAGEMAFVSVNVDEERALSERYGISSLPTLKFFCDGREVGEMVGALPRDQLQSKFREVITMHRACLATSSPLVRATPVAGSA